MKDAILFVDAGECSIDIDKAIKKWTLLCRIIRTREKFTILQLTPKGKVKLKCTISSTDALELIKKLKLRGVEHELFNNSRTYLSIGG